ncbi:cytidylate kinase [Catalinimonas alkaloidigena]|uniref:(d)CMP kinase n=1 Tax=Catalinimonas alkaloidigena TaxID=1075417 RepID=UPI0024050110|nr:(d)CMP kinase [Catalinimonas alkaloidigena]MDF9795268.1 cytidylate kinase [Catalinimonas alkaloidigena]
MQDIIIALDGYSGCGKSSTAKEVAKALKYTYLDSGAMYRAVTLYFLRHQVNLQDSEVVAEALDAINIRFSRNEDSLLNETYLNGENVEEEIRKMEVSKNVSAVSALPVVRKKMVSQQRALGKDKRVVMDGRDIGSHVFPEAELKIFMTADLKVRAERRMKELAEKGGGASLEEIENNLRERDKLDSSRAQSPLIRTEDAIEIDTTYLNFDEQVKKIVDLAKKLIER